MRRPDAEATDPIAAADWAAVAAALDEQGYATLPLLSAEECRALSALYDDDELFRRRIVMQRHAYGSGEYKYFRYPLPDLIAAVARGDLSAAGADRQRLASAAARGRGFSAGARGISRRVS